MKVPVPFWPRSKRNRVALTGAAIAVAAAAVVSAFAFTGGDASAAPHTASGSAGGLGPVSGLLPRDHLTEESLCKST